ncbi:MAG: hypothetical protein KDD44_02105, partial [Bdellovibrionales bacterium]|nr:hypothetical protein [Bdellovibrionales bacterium]
MAYLDDLLADPVEAVSRRRRERSTKSYTAPLTPQQQIGVLNHIGHGTISGLSAIGNVLDLPGSSVRDIVGGENPFDQWIPTNWASSENRLTGRDLARRWGMAGSQDNWGNWTGGLGLEIGLDPLTYLGGAGFAKTAVGKAGKIFGLADDAARGLSVAGRSVGRAEGLARGTLGDAIVAARNPTQATLRNSPGIRLTKPFDEAKEIARTLRYGGQPGAGAAARTSSRAARQTGPRISEALAEPLGTGWTAHLPLYGQLDLAGLGARVGMPNLGRGAASQAFARGKDTIWDAFRSTAPIRHVRQMFDSRVMSTTEPYAQKLAEDFHSRFGPAQAAAAMTQHDALASVEDIFKEFMTTYRPAFKASGRTTNQASLDALTTFNDMLRHGMETGERSQMLEILHDRVGLAYANRAPGTRVLDSMLAAGNRIKQWKDRGTNEVQRMGGNMKFMGALEEGFMSEHFPRSVNPEFAKQYGHRIVNTISNRVLKQRDEAVRYVPTEILNRMLGDTSLRDAINRGTGADRIRQHSVYGRFLDASDPIKHSQDVANWLSGRGRGRLYNEDPFKDLLSYQRGMEIYKSSLRAVHHQLINNAFDPGKLPGGGTTLKKVFEDANMNPDTAMEFFRDISGNKTRSLDDISKMLVPNDVADAIKTVLHPQHFPKFMEQSLNIVDRLNGLFKNSVTVLAPLGIPLFASFFSRNKLSGQFANVAFLGLDNIRDLGSYVRGYAKSIGAIADAVKRRNQLNAGQPLKITLAQAMDRDPEMVNMVVHGVLGHKVGFEGVEQALREGAAPQWPWDFKATMEEVLGKHGPMPSKALHGE